MSNESINALEKETAAPQYSVKSYYLRNISLETGISPVLLRPGIQPEMKLELRINTNSLENLDEVVIDLSLTARDNSNLLYLLKIQQAGCFVLNHFTSEQKTFFLNTMGPSLIYPYACQMANMLSVQAGFPPLNLMPIDFVHMYQQQQQQSAAQVKASTHAEEKKPAHPSTQTQASPALKTNSKWAEVAEAAD